MTDDKRDVAAIVHSNLTDALQNDYDVRSWCVNDIVTDLQCFAEDCEGMSAEHIHPHVITWLELHRQSK